MIKEELKAKYMSVELSNNRTEEDLTIDRSSTTFQKSKESSSTQVDTKSSFHEGSNKSISNDDKSQNLREGKGTEGAEGALSIENQRRDVEESILQLNGKDEHVQSIYGTDMLTNMSALLFSDSAFLNQSSTKDIQNTVMNDIPGMISTDPDDLLTEIKEVVSAQDSILDDNTLISTVLELQEELLELSDNLYLGDDPSAINAQVSLLINTPNTQG